MSNRLSRMSALLTAAALLSGLLLSAPAALASAQSHTYLVVYNSQSVPSGVAKTVKAAGGTLVASYSAIGVAVARSSSATFSSAMKADGRVAAATSTDRLGVQIRDSLNEADGLSTTANIPATDTDNLSGLQWDMIQIHTPEAHAISGGDPAVLVGDIDTGLDFTHPDLAPNYDALNSTDCSSGAPSPLLPGNDVVGHGTHTAGTIAAASNATGIVGVAPNVKIAGIKSSNDSGFFFPEMVVCAFMWAAEHDIDVTNNSYFVDPWLFNCKNDPEQRAIYDAVSRAIKYAMKQGTVVVAAMGNFADDLAHPTQDVISPDYPPGSEVTRPVDNNCRVLPVEVPGVIGVTANGNRGFKSFYSSYGKGVAEVIAPGGDSILQVTAEAVNGRVLSTYPAATPCLRQVFDPTTGAKYCYLQGTSMASPHVAGVAALIMSSFPGIKVGAVTARLKKTADAMACPDTAMYGPFPSTNNGAPQVCEGGTGNNGFNGKGQVNALSAITE